MLGPASRSRRLLWTSAVLMGLIAGCTGERPVLSEEPEPTTTSEAPTTTTEDVELAQVAEADAETIEVFADETSTGVEEELSAASVTSAAGIPITFLVKGRGEDRVEVYLPSEPPGSTGWVRASDVTLSSVPFRIEVDLTQHQLRVSERDEVVLQVAAGIGPDLPGEDEGLFLKELVQPPEDDGPYGAYVYGLAGAPTVRTGLEDGEGVVGIHGTDDPDAIGTDMETGSVAISADALARLVDGIGLPLGTPVEIVR